MELWQTFFFPLPEEVTYTSTAPALRRAAEMCPAQLSGWTNWKVICQLESNFPVRMKWSTYLLLPRDDSSHSCHQESADSPGFDCTFPGPSASGHDEGLLPVSSELDPAHSRGWNQTKQQSICFDGSTTTQQPEAYGLYHPAGYFWHCS